MDARNRWFVDELLPKLTVRFWIGIGISVSALCGALFFVVNSLITQFELRLGKEFVSITQHRDDMDRVEKKIDSLGADVTDALQDVSEKLDRNLQYIRGAPR